MSEATEAIAENYADEAAPARRWTEHISWGATLALAWMIYEMTTKPGIGIVVACAKFGWNDIVTAHWLVWRDPRKSRGWTCFFFYMAAGLWKMTVAAFLLTGVILTVAMLMGQKPPRVLRGLGLTAAVGITLLAVVPSVGVALARWFRLKVWIDSSVHHSRRADQFPPTPTGFNMAAGLLFPALIVPIVLTALVTARLGPWLMLMCLFTAGLIIWRFFRGIAAHHPTECWDEVSELESDIWEDDGLDPTLAELQPTTDN